MAQNKKVKKAVTTAVKKPATKTAAKKPVANKKKYYKKPAAVAKKKAVMKKVPVVTKTVKEVPVCEPVTLATALPPMIEVQTHTAHHFKQVATFVVLVLVVASFLLMLF